MRWQPGPHAAESSASYHQEMVAAVDTTGSQAVFSAGDADGELKRAKTVVRADYTVPFLAHATLEPMNCTAHWDGQAQRMTLWAPTQDPETAATVHYVHDNAVGANPYPRPAAPTPPAPFARECGAAARNVGQVVQNAGNAAQPPGPPPWALLGPQRLYRRNQTRPEGRNQGCEHGRQRERQDRHQRNHGIVGIHSVELTAEEFSCHET